MRKFVIGMVIGVSFLSVAIVLAGSLEPPSGPTDPASQMYNLEQIYRRLNTGAAFTKMTAFAEPTSVPADTMYSLDEIMAVARPGALAPRVNKTGQTDCYYSDGTTGTCTCGPANCPSGQDGDLEIGIDPVIAPTTGTSGGYNTPAWTGVRFTDNGDGTVTDNLTALIWLKDASCSDLAGTDTNGSGTWGTAISAADALADGTCGLSDGSSTGDWRLPNVNELHSLIDLTQSSPALPSGHHFTGIYLSVYWSSTTFESSNGVNAWIVDLDNGDVANTIKSNPMFVWPVRGGQ